MRSIKSFLAVSEKLSFISSSEVRSSLGRSSSDVAQCSDETISS